MEAPEASSQSGNPRPDARRSASAMVSGCIVDIAGLPVLLQASDESRAEAMAVLLGELPGAAGPAAATISFGSRPPPVADGVPGESYGDLHLWRAGAVLNLCYGGCTWARATERGVEIGGDGPDHRRAFHYVFAFAVTHLLALHGRFVLHGGAVVRHGGAVLVLGGTGSGKSTLVLAAIRDGWKGLSDDLAVVQQGRAGPEVAGISKPLTVPADVVADPAGGAMSLPGDLRGRYRLDGQDWEPGWHPLLATVAPGHGRERGGGLASLSSASLFELALASFTAATEPVLVRRVLPVAAAVARRPGWELRHAPDPARRLAAAARLLDQVVALA